MHYKLLLYDQKKLMTRLLLTIIPCVLFLPSIILVLPASLNKEILSIIIILYILIILATLFLSLKGLFSKETIEVQTTSFVSKKFGEISLYDVKKMKFETYKGLRIRLYLKNGLVLGISPFNQFKSNAAHQFMEFYHGLKLKYETTAHERLAKDSKF